ncbi:MAG: hypothetical protein EOL95_11775, partial [Bacteroidia bacterium]|nr:hypothetical protein [Bacteroidia bacterium]
IMDYRKNIMSRYTYNHTGERAVKRYGAFESMAVNGAPAGSKLDANAKYSAYVSPYYVENGSGTKSGAFSKHYYAGSDRIASKTADDAYFYFTDHLGSTTHITDRSGDVAQYAAYTPYGSLFREYRSVQPYKFNGKELDQETGYYYYGARYYDPSSTLFLGVDPLAEKYPFNSGYVYCNGNPVKYVDPDGREYYEGIDGYKWLNSQKDFVVDSDGLTYSRYGTTISGYDEIGSFVYGDQHGCYYDSAPLPEVVIESGRGEQYGMTRAIHRAQNDFLTSDYTIGTAIGMTALFVGTSTLFYTAVNTGMPYMAAGSEYAKMATVNGLLNTAKGYNIAINLGNRAIIAVEGSTVMSVGAGIIDGVLKTWTNAPIDSPYLINNPFYQFSSDISSYLYQLFDK